MSQVASTKPLPRKQKRQLDRLLLMLMKYLDTPEGVTLLQRMEKVFRPTSYRVPVAAMLSDREARDLRFIKREIKREHLPSVREVARAIGLKSSRSGALMIQTLRSKGLFEDSR